jgi:uroporphyrinogen III methyltransferase/synthase
MVAPVYQNTPPPGIRNALMADLEAGRIHAITFTSSSTVKNFIDLIGTDNQEEINRLLHGVCIAAIGPITGKTVTDYGLTVDIQPEQYTIEALVSAMVAYYEGEHGAGPKNIDPA